MVERMNSVSLKESSSLASVAPFGASGSFGTSGGFGASFRSWRTFSPLQQLVDPGRFGAALLITSECDGAAWQDGGPFEKGPKLLLPGGRYMNRSRNRYRQQSEIAVELMMTALLEAGVPEERIKQVDCHDGKDPDWDPLREIQQFWRQHLNPVTRSRDALIYYFGFSIEGGAWALTWSTRSEDLDSSKVCIVEPASVLPPPGPEDGVPGARLVVSDAPGSARMWLRPACRLRGVAAWEGDAMPGSTGGPPLARWLAGYMPDPPTGVKTFLQPCPEVGLEDLPCHKELFWGPSPPSSVERCTHLLWELTEFVGAETMRAHRSAAIEEILVKGGPQLLLQILTLITHHDPKREKLALQVLWLLQALAAESPTYRWAGTMNEVLAAVMGVTSRLCGDSLKESSEHPHLLAASLSVLASCASRCAGCCECAATEKWPTILQMITATFVSLEAAPRDKEAQEAVQAACRMVSQVASHRALGLEHQQLFVKLLAMFSAAEAVAEAAAEALLYVTFRCNELKLEILRLIQQFQFEQALCDALLQSKKLGVKEKILVFLRSVSSARPASAVMEAFPSGCVEGGIVDTIIRILRRHDKDPSVQRWGLAALGAICSVDESFAHRGAEGGASSAVLWALGADDLSQAKSLEQDALFCAFALLQNCSGHGLLALLSADKLGRLPALTASAVARGLREEGGPSEAAMWGLRIFERICQKHAFVVEPFVDVILEAMLAQGCLHGTMVAGSNAVSHLASVCPKAREKLLGNYMNLVKAMQSMGHIAACQDTEEGHRQEQELMDWVQVLVDIMGPERPVMSDDDLECAMIKQQEAAEQETKSFSKPGSKAGTKSNTGTKLETASRTGTKLGSKESAAKTRSKSRQ